MALFAMACPDVILSVSLVFMAWVCLDIGRAGFVF